MLKNTIDQLEQQTPGFLREFALVPELCRLKHVGMNCGCEYTSLTHFRNLEAYSRYEHSFRTSQIIWYFTHSPEQALAGLFHDITTPVFAHVVDFMRGDYATQESTENGTAETVLHSTAIRALALKYHINLPATTDYHIYPIADNHSPCLSADRLEYTLGNMANYGLCSETTPAELFADIVCGLNEHNEAELQFRTPEIAFEFTALALQCSNVYICDADRYSMQMLAELLRDAISCGVITEEDLYTTEPQVIQLLNSDALFAGRWKTYCSYTEILTYSAAIEAGNYRIIDAKRRYIDPLVSGHGRVSTINPVLRSQMLELKQRDLLFPIAGR